VNYKLIILKSAADDALEAYCYYEEKQPGLGDRFLSEVLNGIMTSASIRNIMVL
jgi:hypothetical protein